MEGPRPGIHPQENGPGRHKDFRDHAGRPHQGTLPAAAKGPARGGIHVGQGGENQQHHTHGVHLPPESPANEGMTEFMQTFNYDQAQIQ